MKNTFVLAIAVIAIATHCAFLSAQSTSFTYQGELNHSGSPANGQFDMTFSLWTSPNGGILLHTIEISNVNVSNGRFTVELDFVIAALNNDDRWLEVTVEEFTMSPRNPITRSPYSLQTRGIFVDDDEHVGVGTASPAQNARMTVVANSVSRAIHATSNTAFHPTIYALNNNTAGPVLRADGVSDVEPGGGGVIEIGQLNDFNLALDRNEIQARHNGQTSTLFLNDDGGDTKIGGRLGIGAAPNLAQLTIVNTDPAAGLGIFVQSNDIFPTIQADNQGGGPVIRALGTADVEPAGGGLLVLGSESDTNIGIDRNEIMARDNGAPSTLFVNHEGGNVVIGAGSGGTSDFSTPGLNVIDGQVSMGPHNIYPAFAYGFVDGAGNLSSGSSNIVSTTKVADGHYLIEFDVPLIPFHDIIIVSSANVNSCPNVIDGKLRVLVEDELNIGARFVIYRP